MRHVFLALIALACSGSPAAFADDTQLWTGLGVKGKLSERWSYSADTEFRFTDDVSTHSISLIRGSVTYRFDNGVRAGGGVTRYYNGGLFSNRREDRLYQQVAYPLLEWAGGAVSGRTRTEQRFNAAGGDTGWRVRQRFSYDRPLGGTGLDLTLWSEAYVALNATDWGQDAGFDQWRNGVSVKWDAADNLSIETGYMLIAIDGEDDLFSERRHTLMLSATLSL